MTKIGLPGRWRSPVTSWGMSRMTVVPAQAGASSVVEATYFGQPFNTRAI
jgi:hypothetical protein